MKMSKVWIYGRRFGILMELLKEEKIDGECYLLKNGELL